MPESPGYLRASDAPQAEANPPKGLASLFVQGLARDTIAVWAAFFLCLIAVYATFSWLPATLAGAEYDQRTASLGLASFNLGGVAGALICAIIIGRLGSKVTMTGLATIGVLVAAMVLVIGPGTITPQSLLIAIGALGFAVNGVQTTLFAMAANIYPARIRATGVGAALGFGRVGAMASALAGSFVLSGGSTNGFFLVLALAMAGAAIALLVIKQHIPASRALPAADVEASDGLVKANAPE